MSTLTQPGLFKSHSYDAGIDSRHTVGAGIGALVRNAWFQVQRLLAERRAIRDLRRLSDYELRDIGITRGDIEAAVRGEFSNGQRHG